MGSVPPTGKGSAGSYPRLSWSARWSALVPVGNTADSRRSGSGSTTPGPLVCGGRGTAPTALCTTIVTAIGRIAAAIGCTFTVDKITRCSTTGAILADELSKGRFAAFRAKLPPQWAIDAEPAWIPPAILKWIHNPVADPGLGDAILRDMSLKDGLL